MNTQQHRSTTRAAIGLLGGTFDPIHLGHLRIALEVAEQLQLADMRLLPNYLPPHRDPPLLTPAQRLRAIEQAVAEVPELSLELSEWQAVESGVADAGYTVDTLRRLRAELGSAPIVFVVGDDAFAAIDSWKEHEALLDLCHIVVASRPGYKLPAGSVAETWLQRYAPPSTDAIHTLPAGTVQRCEVTQLDISATQIRQLLANKRSPRYLVPDAILPLLEKNDEY